MDIKENNILITHCEKNARNPLTGFLPLKFKLADSIKIKLIIKIVLAK